MYHDFPDDAKFRILGNSETLEKVSRIVEVIMLWKKPLPIWKLL